MTDLFDAKPLSLAAAKDLLLRTRHIEGANFSGLDMRRTIDEAIDKPYVFEHCNLDDSKLIGAPLRGTSFIECSLNNTNLRGADLEESIWTNVVGQKLDATDAKATDALFDHCSFVNAHWSRSMLTGAKFTDSRLSGADFLGCRALYIEFVSCLMRSCILRGLSFRKQTLTGLDLTEADLAGVDFRDAIFVRCRLADANFTNAQFDGADLRGADIGDLSLSNCGALRGAIISSSQATQLLNAVGLIVV